jgi:hypothetical protein
VLLKDPELGEQISYTLCFFLSKWIIMDNLCCYISHW